MIHLRSDIVNMQTEAIHACGFMVNIVYIVMISHQLQSITCTSSDFYLCREYKEVLLYTNYVHDHIQIAELFGKV